LLLRSRSMPGALDAERGCVERDDLVTAISGQLLQG
jgi:hypothetical protein